MLNSRQLLERCRSSQRLFLALDRDGTLVPYADRPEQAVMPPQTRAVLNSLAQLPGIALALVSARGNARLKDDVDAQQIILAGNYGMEIRLADGQQWIAPGALKAVPELRRLRKELSSIAERFAGTILEDDYYSFCLHWHLLAVDQREPLYQALKQIEPGLTSVSMRTLPTSYEFLPKMSWSKSHALETITSRMQLLNQDCLYLYIGDSEQDEPAFDWANNRGGYSVRVGSGHVPTKATFWLDHPRDLTALLTELLRERSLFAASAHHGDENVNEHEKRIEAVFITLQKEYAHGLSERLRELESIVLRAQNHPDDLESLAEAHMQVHRMKGTSGSYGFTELSLLLAEIEAALDGVQKANSDIHEQWCKAAPLISSIFARTRRETDHSGHPWKQS